MIGPSLVTAPPTPSGDKICAKDKEITKTFSILLNGLQVFSRCIVNVIQFIQLLIICKALFKKVLINRASLNLEIFHFNCNTP